MISEAHDSIINVTCTNLWHIRVWILQHVQCMSEPSHLSSFWLLALWKYLGDILLRYVQCVWHQKVDTWGQCLACLFMFAPILCFRLPKDWCCLGNAPGLHFQPLGQKIQETSSRSLVGTAPYVCVPDVTPDQSSQASIFTYSNPRLKAREQLMHSFSLKFPWLHSEPTC